MARRVPRRRARCSRDVAAEPRCSSRCERWATPAVAGRVWITPSCARLGLQPAEELFGRCLLTVPYLELWQLYLVYLGQKGAPAQEMQQAYELLFEAVGADANAGAVWLEYIGKLQAAVAPGTPASSATVAATRRAFRAALVQPVGGLENIWKTYEDWQPISPDTAKQEPPTDREGRGRPARRPSARRSAALRFDDLRGRAAPARRRSSTRTGRLAA